MHRVTNNNDFTVEPESKGRWRATMSFHNSPVPNGTEERTSRIDGNGFRSAGSTMLVWSVAGSPAAALASLWAYAEEIGAWGWNTWVENN